MNPRARTVVAGLVLAAVVALLAARAAPLVNEPGRPDASHWVLQDFRDAVYYPVVAFLDGRNPYDQAAQARAYPVGQSFPLYLPVTLLVHLPFGLLPPAEAGGIYALVTLGLTAVLAVLALGGAGVPVTAGATLALTVLLLALRPGQMNLLLGQVSVQVAIGAAVALRWARTRPVLASLGLALATLKPTYGVPLAVLMLIGRADTAAVVTGTLVATGACALALVPLVHAAGGMGAFVASLGSSAAAFAAEGSSDAWASFARLDVTALVARGLGRAPDAWLELMLGAAIVGAAVIALRRLRADASAPSQQLGVGLVCLTILVATYHQTYDALLLAQPAVALGTARWGRGIVAPAPVRWSILALLAVPAVNFLASNAFAGRLVTGGPVWLAVTAANPAALLAAWAVHLRYAWGPLDTPSAGGSVRPRE